MSIDNKGSNDSFNSKEDESTTVFYNNGTSINPDVKILEDIYEPYTDIDDKYIEFKDKNEKYKYYYDEEGLIMPINQRFDFYEIDSSLSQEDYEKFDENDSLSTESSKMEKVQKKNSITDTLSHIYELDEKQILLPKIQKRPEEIITIEETVSKKESLLTKLENQINNNNDLYDDGSIDIAKITQEKASEYSKKLSQGKLLKIEKEKYLKLRENYIEYVKQGNRQLHLKSKIEIMECQIVDCTKRLKEITDNKRKKQNKLNLLLIDHHKISENTELAINKNQKLQVEIKEAQNNKSKSNKLHKINRPKSKDASLKYLITDELKKANGIIVALEYENNKLKQLIQENLDRDHLYVKCKELSNKKTQEDYQIDEIQKQIQQLKTMANRHEKERQKLRSTV